MFSLRGKWKWQQEEPGGTKHCWSWHLMTGGEWTHQALHFMIQQTGKFVLDCINFCCALSTSEKKGTNWWKLQGTKARRVHRGQEVGNTCHMEVNVWEKKRQLITPLENYHKQWLCSLDEKKCVPSSLLPSPTREPLCPGANGFGIWRSELWVRRINGVIFSEVRQATKKSGVHGGSMQKPSLHGLGF